MASTPEVRPAVSGDAPAIAALLTAGSRAPEFEMPEDPQRYAAAIERIREAHGEVLVAEVDGAVVGILQLMLLAHLQHSGGMATEIESVHVAAAHRRTGVGTALLDAAVAWGVEQGCYRVQLTSHLSREEAHRFYDASGFEPSHVGYRRSV
jgi:GNAT superfamily N-acetyltransferase